MTDHTRAHAQDAPAREGAAAIQMLFATLAVTEAEHPANVRIPDQRIAAKVYDTALAAANRLAQRTPAAVEPAQGENGNFEVLQQCLTRWMDEVELPPKAIDRLREILQTTPVAIRTPAEGDSPPYEDLRKTNVELMAKLRDARAQVEDDRKQAFAEAMDELDKLRTLAATDFKSPNCQGQRGVDRTDAFFDAYHAIRKLSVSSTLRTSNSNE